MKERWSGAEGDEDEMHLRHTHTRTMCALADTHSLSSFFFFSTFSSDLHFTNSTHLLSLSYHHPSRPSFTLQSPSSLCLSFLPSFLPSLSVPSHPFRSSHFLVLCTLLVSHSIHPFTPSSHPTVTHNGLSDTFHTFHSFVHSFIRFVHSIQSHTQKQ